MSSTRQGGITRWTAAAGCVTFTQIRWLAKGDTVGQVRFVHQMFGIAA
jgi:hypothetical protein